MDGLKEIEGLTPEQIEKIQGVHKSAVAGLERNRDDLLGELKETKTKTQDQQSLDAFPCEQCFFTNQRSHEFTVPQNTTPQSIFFSGQTIQTNL